MSEKNEIKNPTKSIWDNKVVDVITSLLWMLAFIIFGQNLGSILCFGITKLPFGSHPAVITGNMYLNFIGIWIVVIAYLALTKRNRPMLKALGTKPKGNRWTAIPIGLFFGTGLNLICVLAAYVNGDIRLRFDNFHLLYFVFLLFTVLIQSGAEELIERLFLYQRLRRCFKNPWIAIVGNSILFSLLHVFNSGITKLAMLNIVIVAILFSCLVYYMDSLWAAIIAHTSWNFTQSIVLGLPNSGQVVPYSIFKLDAANARNSLFYNVGFGIEGTVFTCVVLTLATIGVIVWGIKKNKFSPSVWE